MDSKHTILPSKRKRTHVSSYAEPEEDNDLYECSLVDTVDDEISTVDTEYGSHRKSKRTKARAKRVGIARCDSRPKKPFRFLDLPPELRDEIYKLALVESGTMTLVFKMKASRRIVARSSTWNPSGNYYSYPNPRSQEDSDPADKWEHGRLSPNLLAVNKQINREASAHLYQQPIALEDTRALHTFLAAIGPSNRLLLSNIIVRCYGSGRGALKAMNYAALTSLAPCVNLKKLKFDCCIGWWYTPKSAARQVYRDGHYFFEAYGCAKGKRDAGMDVIELRKWSEDYRTLPEPMTAADSHKCEREFQAELRKLLV